MSFEVEKERCRGGWDVAEEGEEGRGRQSKKVRERKAETQARRA